MTEDLTKLRERVAQARDTLKSLYKRQKRARTRLKQIPNEIAEAGADEKAADALVDEKIRLREMLADLPQAIRVAKARLRSAEAPLAEAQLPPALDEARELVASFNEGLAELRQQAIRVRDAARAYQGLQTRAIPRDLEARAALPSFPKLGGGTAKVVFEELLADA